MSENLELETEQNKENIISQNLAKMEGEMMIAAQKDSFRGSSPKATIEGKRYVCSAANGLVNNETGEITAFGNMPDVLEKIGSGSAAFTYRIAWDDFKPFRIVDVYSDRKLAPVASTMLKESMDRWNQKHQLSESMTRQNPKNQSA